MWLHLTDKQVLINHDNISKIYTQPLHDGTIGIYVSLCTKEDMIIAKFMASHQVTAFVRQVIDLIERKVDVIDISVIVNSVKLSSS